MAAAAKTPTVVCKNEKVLDVKTGTPIRVIEYYIKVTKATQNDWILLETAIGSTAMSMVDVHGIVLDSSSDMVQEGFTYDDSEDKLVLTSATVGTAHIWVTMSQA